MNDRQFGAAREAVSRAQQIIPESTRPALYLSETELLDGHAEKALTLSQSFRPGGKLFGTAVAAHTLGRSAESQRALNELIAGYAQTFAYQIAQIYAWRGETEKAFEWLERSYAQHDSGLQWIKTDPFLDSIRADARYGALLRKMNLPE